MNDSELGRRLQMDHALRWIHAARGDPYCRILCALDPDPTPLVQQIHDEGDLVRSANGTWVTARAHVAREILDAPGTGARRPDGAAPAARSVLPTHELTGIRYVPEDRLRAMAGPLFAPEVLNRGHPVLKRHCDTYAGHLGDAFDVVVDFARPCVLSMLAAMTGVPESHTTRFKEIGTAIPAVLDLQFTAQPLRVTKRTLTGLRELYSLYADLLSSGRLGSGAASAEIGPELGDLVRSSPTDLASVLVAVIAQSVEPIVSAISGAVLDLLAQDRPAEHTADENDSIDQAATDVLRARPPVRLRARMAYRDLLVAGEHVTAGELLVILVNGTNQAGPGRSRPSQALDEVLAPGGMPWTDLSTVARLTRVALRALSTRHPRLYPSGPPLPRPRSPVVSGPDSFPVVSA